MAKLTGQFTTPSLDASNNKINKPFLHGVVFVFQGATKVTRESDDKGKYSFDLANGEYDVSVYLKGNTEKDRFDMRQGEKFVVTSTTKADALDKWLQVIGDGGKDELAAYYENLLAQMQAVYKQFQDETKADGTGLFVKQSSVKKNSLKDSGRYTSSSNIVPTLKAGDSGLALGPALLVNNPGLDFSGLTLNNGFMYYEVQRVFGTSRLSITVKGYNFPFLAQSVTDVDGVWSKPVEFRSTYNTAPDKNGVLHTGTGTGTGAPKDTLVVGDAGLGSNIKVLTGTGVSLGKLTNGESGFYAVNAYETGYQRNYTVYLKHTSSYESALTWDYGGNRLTLETISPGGKSEFSVLHSKNTVIDSNGNYKPASPVIQLHHDKVEYNEDFDKDNPPEFEHLETGVYRITNVREISKEGWKFNKPINGKSQPYFMIKYEQEDATTLLVRVFERTFDKNTGEFGFGEPRDIGADERWIDFHFEVDHERIAREEAQMQKEQEEFEEQERLRKEADEQAEKEAQEAWEAEIAKQEAEMLAEMEEKHKEE